MHGHTISIAIAVTAAGLAASATGQDLIVTPAPVGANEWTIDAEFLSAPPSSIVQIWADTSFELRGDAPITITGYNPSYDTSLGNAVISGNGTNVVTFVGNANAFFGAPDGSNPLSVADFTYSGSTAALKLRLVGQNSAIFDLPPFGDVRLYQDAQGNPGELSFLVIPAPASFAVLGVAGLVGARRRRK